MAVTYAVLCDTSSCVGLYVCPTGSLLEDLQELLRDAGWRHDDGRHTCPGCQRDQAVLERGLCPRCGGTGHHRAEGYQCDYCQHMIELPDDPDAYSYGSPPATP
jgi:hypothetical protein